MALNSLTRVEAMLSAEKQEAGTLPESFKRVLLAIRKFNSIDQLKLFDANEECFMLVGSAFDMDRDILKAVLMNRCTISVLPQDGARVSVVIGKQPDLI